MANNRIKATSTSDRIFGAFIYVYLIATLIIVLYPLIYIVSSSFSSPNAVTSGRVWLFPVNFSLEGYKAIFRNQNVLIGYKNTILYTILGTFINIFITISAAFPLSRQDFWGRGFIMKFFTFTMIFSGGLIPLYITVHRLGLIDTVWAMVLPTAMGVYQMIIARTFFQSTIPMELSEAAEIDGANEFQFIWHIVLPLSKSIIAVLVLMYAVQHWNAFFHALIFLKSPEKFSLQVVLRSILIQNTIDYDLMGGDVTNMMKMQGLRDLLKYSLIVVASLPVLVLYPFVQRYFVKGVMIGAIKS